MGCVGGEYSLASVSSARHHFALSGEAGPGPVVGFSDSCSPRIKRQPAEETFDSRIMAAPVPRGISAAMTRVCRRFL